tara:strand:- start:150 stop:584 length:435 start_codon:yes stop_codon:yes gene_type:complete
MVIESPDHGIVRKEGEYGCETESAACSQMPSDFACCEEYEEAGEHSHEATEESRPELDYPGTVIGHSCDFSQRTYDQVETDGPTEHIAFGEIGEGVKGWDLRILVDRKVDSAHMKITVEPSEKDLVIDEGSGPVRGSRVQGAAQ